MTDFFRLAPKIKSRQHYVVFSEGLQDKLSEIIWENPNTAPIDARWKILGTAQHGITKKIAEEIDYLPAFVSIPLFSQRASKIILEECDGIDFIPCCILVDGAQFDFFIGRIHQFLPLINHEASNQAERLSPLAPIIINSEVKRSFFLARDTEDRTKIICSNEFRELCIERKLNIDFHKFEDLENWLKRQPPDIINKI